MGAERDNTDVYCEQTTVGSGDNAYYTDAEGKAYAYNSAGFKAALGDGKDVVMAGDVSYSGDIAKDTTIDLGDKKMTMTGSDQKVSGDLTVSNGTVDVSTGYFDVRPSDESVITFENVNFVSTAKNKTYGNSTNRVGSALEFCPAEAGGKVEIKFKNCTFTNAQVLLEAMSEKGGEFAVTFEGCTFENFGNANAIEVSNYLTGKITIKDCTFNITATSNVSIVYALTSSTVTVNFEGTNTVNGTAATPTTDPALVGTVDEIKVFTTQSVKITGGVDAVNGLDTVTVSGIASK